MSSMKRQIDSDLPKETSKQTPVTKVQKTNSLRLVLHFYPLIKISNNIIISQIFEISAKLKKDYF